MQTFAGPYVITNPGPFTSEWYKLVNQAFRTVYSATIDAEHWWSDGAIVERLAEAVPQEVDAIDQTEKMTPLLEQYGAYETVPLPTAGTADSYGSCTFQLDGGPEIHVSMGYLSYLAGKGSRLHAKKGGSEYDPLIITDVDGNFAGALMPVRPLDDPLA